MRYTRGIITPLLLMLAVTLARPLLAQERVVGAPERAGAAAVDTVTAAVAMSPLERAEARAIVALPAWLGGALAGGGIGYFLVPAGDDGRGGREFVIGATVGGIIASSVTTGVLALGDGCGASDRFVRSVAGAGLGTIAALTLAYIGRIFVVTVPVGAVGGAVGGAMTCVPRDAR